MKVLLDSDIVLELLLNRGEYVAQIEHFFLELNNSEVEAYITDSCLKKIACYAPSDCTELTIDFVMRSFDTRILPVEYRHIINARSSPLASFESAVEVVCAVEAGFDAIFTHSPNEFIGSTFPVFSISEFSKQLQLYQHRSYLRQCFDLRVDEVDKSESVLKNSNNLFKFLWHKT